MFPIFFSVSSKDIEFAERVWEKFPDDWVYLYSKTGEAGVHMWEEISRQELPHSKLLVIFWSSNFPTAQGCVREIIQARDLLSQGHLKAVVIRLDDYPITWKADLGDEVKPVFDALKPMLDFRTSQPHVSAQQAIHLLQRVSEPILKSDHPRLLRPDLHQTMRETIKKERFAYYPAMWVSGFDGVGRETIVRELNHNFAPNGRAVVIEVNESSLPRQILLRIESEAFGASIERLRQLSASQISDGPKEVAAAIDSVFAAGNYLILRHARIVEDSVDLPLWLDDVINALPSATRPKVFVISRMPLLAERRNRCRESLVAQRVPTVDEHQLTEFCYQLLGYFDKNPGRWSDPEIEKIVSASGGNIGFLVSIVRSSAAIDDFDHIDQLVAADRMNMVASVTAYVRWAFAQLREFEDEQRTLLLLNDISPCDIADIERMVAPTRDILRVLGKLLELGLVEREGEGLFRLTPMLSNRLSRDLVRPELLAWLRNALVEFVKNPLEFETGGHEFVRIESRIQAALMAEPGDLPSSVMAFVSAAHWFQAGVRLYHARRREPAYRILRRAYLKRSEFDGASRAELARYFCLSATRNRKYKEAEECIKLLDSAFQTKGMASFLRADMLEYKREFGQAIIEYKNSIELNKGKTDRLERTYRPLIRCILASFRPDYEMAERYALESLRLRRTIFSLMALARIYLHWKHLGLKHQRDVPHDIESLYSNAVSELEADPGVGSAHFELRSEEAEFSRDFIGAVDYMDAAISADPRFELRSERWRLMAKSKLPALAEQVLVELDAAKHNTAFRSNWVPFLPTLAETYAFALKAAGRPLGSLNTFATELSGDEIGPLIARVNKTS